MQKFFRIRPIQWALYAGGYIILLAATIIGLGLDSINNDGKRLLIIGFAACVIFLFFIFFSFLKKTLVMPRLLFALFVINNAALLTVGLGIIPILLYEQALVDKNFPLFSPTGVIALVIASTTAFFCYWLYSGILSLCCRFRAQTIFSKIRDATKQNASFIVCIGIIVFFLLVISGFLFGGFGGIPPFLELLIAPFVVYVFIVIANQNFALLTALLLIIFFVAYGFLLCKSNNYEKTANKQEFFSSVILCSRHVFIVHLIFWAVYMKLFGIVFEFGSWNPFQIL